MYVNVLKSSGHHVFYPDTRLEF